MANPHKGQLEFEADGRRLTLHYSTNAICELEDELDRSFISISKEMAAATTEPDRIRFSTLRAILWAGLRDHHPEIDIKSAGDLMISVGGVVKAMQLISEGFSRAFPAPESKGARPPKGVRTRNGIGLDS